MSVCPCLLCDSPARQSTGLQLCSQCMPGGPCGTEHECVSVCPRLCNCPTSKLLCWCNNSQSTKTRPCTTKHRACRFCMHLASCLVCQTPGKLYQTTWQKARLRIKICRKQTLGHSSRLKLYQSCNGMCKLSTGGLVTASFALHYNTDKGWAAMTAFVQSLRSSSSSS